MHLHSIVLFKLFLPSIARRSIRIVDSRYDSQEQTKTLTKTFEVSGDAREALLPRGLSTGKAGALHATFGQGPQVRAPHDQHLYSQNRVPFAWRRLSQFSRAGPRRTMVALNTASGPKKEDGFDLEEVKRNADSSGEIELDKSAQGSVAEPGSMYEPGSLAEPGSDKVNPAGALDSMSSEENTGALKQALLKKIGQGSEAAILRAAADLEATRTRNGSVSGRWALVFSTQTDRPTDSPMQSLLELPQEVSNRIYSTLFKFAPFLAGGSNREQSGINVANEQTIDEAKGIIDNRVRVSAFGQTTRIRVYGTAKPTDDASKLEITFEGFQVNDFLSVPLPRPKGSVVTTFVDDDLRLSRGSRGGLFVLKRMRGD